MSEVLDLLIKVAAAVGLPGLLTYWLTQRGKTRNEVSKSKKQIPYEVRATAATTLDSEVAALQKAFELDRRTRNTTIADLTAELAEARAEIDLKDAKIDELKRKFREAQDKMAEMQRQMRDMAANLAEAQQQLEELSSNHS